MMSIENVQEFRPDGTWDVSFFGAQYRLHAGLQSD